MTGVPIEIAQAQSFDGTRVRYRDYQYVDDIATPVVDPSKQLLVVNAASGNVTVTLSNAEVPPELKAERPQSKYVANVGTVFSVIVQSASASFAAITVAPDECVSLMYVRNAGGTGGTWTPMIGASGGGGGGNDGGTGAGAIDKLFWTGANGNVPVFPVAGSGDTRAYYPVVLYDSNAPFSPDGGTTNYAWVGVYAGSGVTRQTFAFSNDGFVWTSPTKPTGTVAGGYHAELCIVESDLRMWYWDPSLLYTPAAMRTATCPLTNIGQFVDDTPCANGTPPWTGQPAPAWNRGTYGPTSLFYTRTPTNVPGQPETFRFYGMVDETTGGAEELALITSDDAVTWALADPNPVIPNGNGAGWDATHLDAGSAWQIAAGETQILFSAGNGSLHDGIGFAYSATGIGGPWTKHTSNPVFRRIPATQWSARCYTPSVVAIRDALDRIQLRVYYTGDDGAGTRAVYVANEELHWLEKATMSPETNGQGLRL